MSSTPIAPSSTSTAPSTTQSSSGNCVVCGVVTVKRCSGCAKQGLDWMHFCSEEHQKLIWFMHKRVCGERSNPFVWPKLTKSEVESFVKLGEIWTPKYGSWYMQWSGYGARVSSIESGRSAFRRMLEDASESNPGQVDGKMVLEHRKNAFLFESLIRITERQHVDPVAFDMVKKNPWNYLAYHAHRYYEEKFVENPSRIPWISIFLHRYVIYLAVFVRYLRNFKALPSSVEYAYSELKRYCIEVIRTNQPDFFCCIQGDKDIPAIASLGLVPWSPPEGVSDGHPHMVFRSIGRDRVIELDSYEEVLPSAAQK